ncbi:MAG: hypothetical protein KBE71_08175 [Laribacter sp.]|nr:hypothetical protein [Laribacter sp.]MBP9528314.1 hypothetical protein [Laribacter sp.]
MLAKVLAYGSVFILVDTEVTDNVSQRSRQSGYPTTDIQQEWQLPPARAPRKNRIKPGAVSKESMPESHETQACIHAGNTEQGWLESGF